LACMICSCRVADSPVFEVNSPNEMAWCLTRKSRYQDEVPSLINKQTQK
jgi:hypothetical protein